MSGEYGALHRAMVVSIETQGVIVEVAALAPNAPWGPIPTCVPNLAAGESVLVGQIGVSRDTLVVLGRIPGRAPTIAEIVNLATTITNLQAADTALQAAITAGDNALDARLDTTEANLLTLNAHTHTALPSAAIAGNATVGGTLGVTGATTLVALGAASAAVSGALSAYNTAVFAEQLEAAAHGAWSTKIRAKDNTVHNRSARQPIVHGTFAAAINVIPGASFTLLDDYSWTQRETGNVKLVATIIGGAVNGPVGYAGQIRIRWRLVRVNGPLQLAEQDFFFMSAHVDPAGTGMVNSVTVLGVPNVLLTAGTIYRFELAAIEDAAFGHDIFVRDIAWEVTECIRVD